MSGHAENVDPASADFHDKEDVESAQRDGVEGEEIGGQQPGGLGTQEGSPAGVGSTGCGAETGGGQDSPDRACAYVVSEAGEFTLRRRWPQEGFSCARRRTSSRICSVIGGRPDRFG